MSDSAKAYSISTTSRVAVAVIAVAISIGALLVARRFQESKSPKKKPATNFRKPTTTTDATSEKGASEEKSGESVPKSTVADESTKKSIEDAKSTIDEHSVKIAATTTKISDAEAASIPESPGRARSATEQKREDWASQWIGKFSKISKALTHEDVTIYFGSFPVSFTTVPGTLFAHEDGCIEKGLQTDETRKLASSRLKPAFDHLYVPSLPCPDVQATYTAGEVGIVPKCLRKPLLKANPGESEKAGFKMVTTIKGIRSGGRSAIIVVDGAAYRLKGCGNYVNGEYGGKSLRYPFPGFPIKKMIADEAEPESGKIVDFTTFETDPAAVEVKGCAFVHTAQREQHMAEVMNSILAPRGLMSAVFPIGYWSYALSATLDPAPAVEKVCGLFRTLGERRLASHLLEGLSMLLPRLIPKADKGALLSLFPDARHGPYVTNKKKSISDELLAANKAKEEDIFPVIPTADAMHSTAYGGLKSSPEHGKYDFDPIDCSKVPDISSIIREVPPEFPDAADSHFLELLDFWETPAFEKHNMTHLKKCWSQAKEALATYYKATGEGSTSQASVVAALYYRLGREAGEIKRVMAENGVSWGYFKDHGFEYHNNSHPNNFVVVPEGYGFFLAPLDFDMAFQRDEYFDAFKGTGHEAPDKASDREFSDNLIYEQREMELALTGVNASTGLEGMGSSVKLSEEQKIVQCLMRDTLVAGYRDGIANKAGASTPSMSPELEKACHALVKMALVLSSHKNS